MTVMSPDGKPIQVNSNMLQAAAAQSAAGMFDYFEQEEALKRNVNDNQKCQI